MFLLTLCAGCINAVATLGILTEGEYIGVSHLTGSATKIGTGLSGQPGITTPLMTACGFLVGTIVCGALVPKGLFDPSNLNQYGVLLLLSSSCLFASVVLLPVVSAKTRLPVMLAAAACGAQNGLVTTTTTSIVRTTHVTGGVTDLGLVLGRWLARAVACARPPLVHEDEAYRARVLVVVIGGFVLGAMGGGTLAAYLETARERALLVPAGVQAALGLYALMGGERGTTGLKGTGSAVLV